MRIIRKLTFIVFFFNIVLVAKPKYTNTAFLQYIKAQQESAAKRKKYRTESAERTKILEEIIKTHIEIINILSSDIKKRSQQIKQQPNVTVSSS